MLKQAIKNKFLLAGAVLFLSFVFFFMLPRSALAAQTGELGLMPAKPDPKTGGIASWFVYEAKPGTVIDDVALLSNFNKDQEISVKIYAVDGATTSNGVFALTLAADNQSGIGTWVEIPPLLPETQSDGAILEPPANELIAIATTAEGKEVKGLRISLPAGKSIEVPFKLTVPENTWVGDHTGGLIIETEPKSAEGTGFSIVTRIGARIYLTVPGEKVFDLKINDFSWRIQDYGAEELRRLFFGQGAAFPGALPQRRVKS